MKTFRRTGGGALYEGDARPPSSYPPCGVPRSVSHFAPTFPQTTNPLPAKCYKHKSGFWTLDMGTAGEGGFVTISFDLFNCLLFIYKYII